MNGLDGLRSTLDTHGAALDDSGLTARAVAVQHRIAGVRRRRRAAVAGGAAVVLAVAAGVALLPGPDGPDPVSRIVVGVEAPAELTSLDHTYAFERVVEGDGSTAVAALPASDQPRLVTWATSGDDDEVAVRVRGADSYTSTMADFTDFVVLPPGDPQRVRVEAAQGKAGLAVYELTDARPPGITQDGVTFRRQVADRILVDALVGERGDADISLDVTTPAGRVAYATLCVAGPDGARIRVGRGDGYTESGCNDGSAFDPGRRATTSADLPATDEPTRVWVVDERGTPVSDPDIQLAVGVYVATPGLESAARQRVPELVEQGGHRWRLREVTPAPEGARTFGVDAEGPGPQLAVLLSAGEFKQARPVVGGVETSWLSTSAGSPASWVLGQVTGSAEVTVSLHGEVADGAQFAFALYERAD